MNDTEFKAKINAINDFSEFFDQMIEAIEEGYFGHDPYYNDIKKIYLDKAKEFADKFRKEKDKDNMTPAMRKLLADIDESSDGHVLLDGYNRNTVNSLLKRGKITLLMRRKYGPHHGKVIRRRKNNECQNSHL